MHTKWKCLCQGLCCAPYTLHSTSLSNMSSPLPTSFSPSQFPFHVTLILSDKVLMQLVSSPSWLPLSIYIISTLAPRSSLFSQTFPVSTCGPYPFPCLPPVLLFPMPQLLVPSYPIIKFFLDKSDRYFSTLPV